MGKFMKNFFLGILFLLFSTVFANATADDKSKNKIPRKKFFINFPI
jgi:hypothetical protein